VEVEEVGQLEFGVLYRYTVSRDWALFAKKIRLPRQKRLPRALARRQPISTGNQARGAKGACHRPRDHGATGRAVSAAGEIET
jgi:hypothetical protein